MLKAVIGVPLRYSHTDEGRPILYLGEKVRRTLQRANAEVFTMTPVHDVDYADTKGNEFPELTEEQKMLIHKNLDRCDGLFFPGGNKFTPYDRYLLECAIEKQIPVLAVCLGMQMMSCYEEDVLLEANESESNHDQGNDDDLLLHLVRIDKNSKLYQILERDEILVNSFHNYHATANHIYRSVAYSEDGIIEALEYPGKTFNVGVQWHPEISYSFDDNSRKLIDFFIQEASKNKEKKEILIS